MLKQLYIKHFTLIDELNIKLHSGFSVITGETGAGKSIILGAIGLLLGQRADSKTIKQGTERCVIEAHFDLSRYELRTFFEQNDIDYDASDCIIRRELTISGKSRAFINDTPVALQILKELGERLIDVHSQHQNLLLNKQDFQLNVVDILANDRKELDLYVKAYTDYQQTLLRLEKLRQEIEQNRQNQDFLRYQYDELVNANLMSDEQKGLEQLCETMSHAEEIKSALYQADSLLSAEQTGIISNLHTTLNGLKSIETVLPPVHELVERIDTSYIELKDIASEIGNLLGQIDFDPAELDRINIRLDRIYDLEKKYKVESVDELIALRNQLHQQLEGIVNGDDYLLSLQKEAEQKENICQKHAEELTRLRCKAAKVIEKEMQKRLVLLGMPHVQFAVNIETIPLNRNGQDRVSFLFSANTSTPLQPVSQVASGGEIARVMLSLKAMISGAVKLPTVIFDEIDTGVSGKIAEQMAEIMQEMGKHERQVLCITHLPQIAALGTIHYKVSKEETTQGTISQMRELTSSERISEIAQMLSGSSVSDAAIENARQLLKRNKE